MPTLEMVVAQTQPLTTRIRRLRLARADGAPVPAYTAGAHIELHVPTPPPQAPLHRAYSLVAPADGGHHYEIAVQLEPEGSGGSRWVHQLQAGQRVTVTPPRNQFELDPQATSCLLLAGGIGITPLLCMARELQQQQRSFEFHYAARDREGAAYCDEVEALGGRCWFDGGDPSQGMPLGPLTARPAPGQHLYVCGPKPFIAAALEHARTQGWPEAQLHNELFSGALPAAGEQAFTVELRLSGRTLDVLAGQSVMDAMEAAGLDPLFDCRRGECGVCVTQVLQGEPEHRDICLSERERAAGRFCTCVSRARSGLLVLEL